MCAVIYWLGVCYFCAELRPYLKHLALQIKSSREHDFCHLCRIMLLVIFVTEGLGQ